LKVSSAEVTISLLRIIFIWIWEESCSYGLLCEHLMKFSI